MSPEKKEERTQSIKILLIYTPDSEVPQTLYFNQADKKILREIGKTKIGIEKQIFNLQGKSADKMKSHQRRRKIKEVREVAKSMSDGIQKLQGELRKFSDTSIAPLVIELNGENKTTACTPNIGYQDMQWLNFVSRNPDLMDRSPKSVEIVQKAFRFRLGSFEKEPGAHDKYVKLLSEELRERTDLHPYIRKITEMYGKKNSNY